VARQITPTKALLSVGTAFSFYSNKSGSLLLTAAHNVSSCISSICFNINIRGITDSGLKIPLITLYIDEIYDLAVLFTNEKLDALDLKDGVVSMFADSRIFSFGYQYGGKFGPIFTQGHAASSVFPCPADKKNAILCMLADMRIGGGASGAPVVEGSGRVVGVLIAYTIKHPNLAIFVTTPSVLRFLEDFRNNVLETKAKKSLKDR
jgi:S1-C subfamily serine protease